MKKVRFLFLATTTLLLFTAVFFTSFKIAPEETVFKNILSEIKELNTKEHVPTSEFKKGEVNLTTLNQYLKTTQKGFVIQLPSNTNIPTPVVDDGKIFVSGGFGSKQYFAFDAKTGKSVWAVNTSDDGPSSGVIDSDVLVFNTESCTIFAIDKKSGEMLWSYYLGDPLMSMPTVANGKVFTAYPAGYFNKFANNNSAERINPSHVLIAIDLKTGKIEWQKWIDSDIISAPVAKNNDIYFSTFSGSMYKVSQQTGEFEMALAMRATSAPVIDDNGNITVTYRSDKEEGICRESIAVINGTDASVKTCLMNKKYEYLCGKIQDASELKKSASNLDAGNGFSGGAPESANWSVAYANIGQSNVSSLQSFQGSRILYFNEKNYNTMGDILVCSDPSTGKIVWETKLDGDLKSAGGFLAAPPIKVQDFIVIATQGGEVQVINPIDGKINERYFVGDHIRYQPVVVDGWIYVTTTTGKLFGFDTGNPNLTGWPMWGANYAITNLSN